MGANAVTSVPVYASGDVLTAANLNITNSGVPVFATTVTRDAAFGGTGEKTLAEGQVCYIEAAPDRLQIYNGSAWIDVDIVHTTYTPTLTNVTLGNGTLNGWYVRFGKIVFGGVFLGFGSTTSVTGLIGISLPFTSASGGNNRTLFDLGFSDTGTATYNGLGFIAESSSRLDVYAFLANGTYTTLSASSSTVPFTWTNTDEIWGTFTYRVT